MAGLTIEDVNAMQDEMNPIGDVEEGADAGKLAADGVKSEESNIPTDEAKGEAPVTKTEVIDDKQKEPEVDTRSLREENRAIKEALQKVTGDYQKLHSIMVDKGLITDEEVKATKESEIAAQNALMERQAKLMEMVEIMELNPNYTDVRQVCSQGNLDDVVDAFATYYAKENGGTIAEATTRLTSEIWGEINPYKKIYEIVKKYHPKYAVKEEDATAKEAADAAKVKEIAAEADGVKKKVPIDVQGSAANIGAGGSGAGAAGWTSAKIDALPEDELHTVPKDIYQKYLVGALN